MKRLVRYTVVYIGWIIIFVFGFFIIELKIDTFKKFCGLEMIVIATCMMSVLVHHYFKYKKDERRISDDKNKK